MHLLVEQIIIYFFGGLMIRGIYLALFYSKVHMYCRDVGFLHKMYKSIAASCAILYFIKHHLMDAMECYIFFLSILFQTQRK
jgi:hypothetical protein